MYKRQEKLLRTQDTAWSRDTDPSDELLSRYLVGLHGIETYQGACAAEPSLAMNGDGSWVRLGEMTVANAQEIFHDIFWRV